MSTATHPRYTRELLAWLPVSGLVVAAIVAIGYLAPRESTMGDVQRIVYIHVAVAWFGLVGLIISAATGLVYLLRRDLRWDHWAQASAEIGWVCASLTLITGSLWAKAAWGTWWTWEPRLTSAFILWAIYSGYHIARNNIENPHQRARLSAVVAIIGALDVPLVIMATRMFRGMHPVAPQMEPAMRVVLLLSVLSFTALFVWLLVQRYRQIHMARELASLEMRLNADSVR